MTKQTVIILNLFERIDQEKISSRQAELKSPAQSGIDDGEYQISTRLGKIKIQVKDSKPYLLKEESDKLAKIYESQSP